MFVRISNRPLGYEWGSPGGIARLLGQPVVDDPQAEYWLGAHGVSPSIIDEPEKVAGARNLADWVYADAEGALGTALLQKHVDDPPRLPFLMKVLTAAKPLSLQAHPGPDLARAGFLREESAAIPLTAPHRNYKDPHAKPELVVALSDDFEALCGFRDVAASVWFLGRLADAAETAGKSTGALREFATRLEGPASLREATAWALAEDSTQLCSELVSAARAAGGIPHFSDDQMDEFSAEDFAATAAMLCEIDSHHPGDSGLVVASLMNRVSLQATEALWMPAGCIHAYLRGEAIELMGASDNVLRGGLTSKHVDVSQLLAVVDFEPIEPPTFPWIVLDSGILAYRPPMLEGELVRVTVTGLRAAGESVVRPQLDLIGPAIVLAVAGEVWLRGGHNTVQLIRGQAVYVTPEEERLSFYGEGVVFVAMPGRGA